ncbi:MAG TPA: hypothetical protein VN037_15480 [Verrucomicrobiae bacterium]|nr:hypothetical protein [Verrucomicrobiae bacterium]
MRKENAGKVLVQYSFVISVLLCIVLAACNETGPKPVGPPVPPPKTVRLAGHAACPNPPKPIPYRIEFNSRGLVDPDNEAILVCGGDTLVWFTTDINIPSFTVDFATHGNSGSPFNSGHQSIPSGAGKQTTDEIIATPQGADHHLKDYIYSIEPYVSAGKALHTIDPHVIPM